MCCCGTRRLLRKILEVEQASMGYLAQIARLLTPAPVTHFVIRRTSMDPLIPGSTATYTATAQPADATLLAPFPTWASSDANVAVSVDLTGLVASIAVSPTLVVPPEGTTFTLAISYTNPDGTPAVGQITDTIQPAPVVVPPVVNVTGFTIARTA